LSTATLIPYTTLFRSCSRICHNPYPLTLFVTWAHPLTRRTPQCLKPYPRRRLTPLSRARPPSRNLLLLPLPMPLPLAQLASLLLDRKSTRLNSSHVSI